MDARLQCSRLVMQEFPRRARGLDYDLNWSLAADAITTRGTAFRNATVRDLVEFSPRGAVRVHKSRALEVTSGPLASAGAGEAFATDVVPGRKVMDVEEYESRLNSVRLAAAEWKVLQSTQDAARSLSLVPPPCSRILAAVIPPAAAT